MAATNKIQGAINFPTFKALQDEQEEFYSPFSSKLTACNAILNRLASEIIVFGIPFVEPIYCSIAVTPEFTKQTHIDLGSLLHSYLVQKDYPIRKVKAWGENAGNLPGFVTVAFTFG